MNQGDKPDLLIFHGPNCLDGFACAWAAWQKWPQIMCHMGIYGQDPPNVEGLRVLIADFSYPEDVLVQMAEDAIEVTVLDHHESARPHLQKLLNENVIKGEYDATRSGAALTWEYVWGSRHPPKLIEHIQDRDLWKWEIAGTAEVTAVAASLGEDFVAWTELGRRVEAGHINGVLAEGAAILRQRARDIATLIRAGRREMVIGGYRVPVVNAPFYLASDIGHELAKGAPFGATYMDMPRGRQFSLRSEKGSETTVNDVAEEYGGGGHPSAAGFLAPPGWEGDADEPPVETIRLKPGAQITVTED